MATSSNPRPTTKISQPARNVKLVMSVMRNLGDENGCTVGNIVGYLADYYGKPAPKREVLTTLKRGVEFGIMEQKYGRYYLTKADEKRQERRNFPDAKVPGASDDLVERGSRMRKPGKTKKTGKSKDSARRKNKVNKKNHNGRNKSMKKARFARSFKSYALSNYYHNPYCRPSAVSSVDSMDFYEGENRHD